ncbi:MAG: metallopeptidase family protein [Gemmataceae bacterium]
MSMKTFGQIVRRVMETLPPEFEPYLDNLVVDVEDEPSRELLRQMDYSEEEIAEGEMMYGLFCPLGPESSDLGGADMENPPRRIIIYKRPLEEDFPDRHELMTEIRKTVIHELAHHFGYSDRDLEKFDDNPDPF